MSGFNLIYGDMSRWKNVSFDNCSRYSLDVFFLLTVLFIYSNDVLIAQKVYIYLLLYALACTILLLALLWYENISKFLSYRTYGFFWDKTIYFCILDPILHKSLQFLRWLQRIFLWIFKISPYNMFFFYFWPLSNDIDLPHLI